MRCLRAVGGAQRRGKKSREVVNIVKSVLVYGAKDELKELGVGAGGDLKRHARHSDTGSAPMGTNNFYLRELEDAKTDQGSARTAHQSG